MTNETKEKTKCTCGCQLIKTEDYEVMICPRGMPQHYGYACPLCDEIIKTES